MLIGLVFVLGCIIGTANSQCEDIVRRLSSQCGVNESGGVCCDYKNMTILNDNGTYHLNLITHKVCFSVLCPVLNIIETCKVQIHDCSPSYFFHFSEI